MIGRPPGLPCAAYVNIRCARMKLTMVYLVVGVLLLFYLIFGHNGFIKYHEMSAVQKSYEEELSRMDERIAYMQRELDLIKKDNAYLEYVIRRELGLQKPDEDQYIVTDNESVPRQ